MIEHEYPRPAKVLRVVDGDTLDVLVDCGFDIHHKIRLRFFGVSAEELDTPAGQAAYVALKDLVSSDVYAAVSVVTKKVDKYGRYLCASLSRRIDGMDVIGRLMTDGHLILASGSARRAKAVPRR
jgi:micrococcal nuclease